jgi:hypothetical protein
LEYPWPRQQIDSREDIMAIPLAAAAAAMREAMRETVKRYSLWYLLLAF